VECLFLQYLANASYFGQVQAVTGGRNIDNIELSLPEMLPVYLVERLYLSVAVTCDKYCIFGWVQ